MEFFLFCGAIFLNAYCVPDLQQGAVCGALLVSGRTPASSGSQRRARDNIHIDANRFIGRNLELLRFGTDTPAHTAFHIKNVNTRRQRNPIIPVRVRSDLRDLFFSVLTPND